MFQNINYFSTKPIKVVGKLFIFLRNIKEMSDSFQIYTKRIRVIQRYLAIFYKLSWYFYKEKYFYKSIKILILGFSYWYKGIVKVLKLTHLLKKYYNSKFLIKKVSLGLIIKEW